MMRKLYIFILFALGMPLLFVKTSNPVKSFIEMKPLLLNGIISLNLISLIGENISINNYAQEALNKSAKQDLNKISTGIYS